ncbi:MAG: hypothetical protein LBW85_06980 [Deltaproteobacteria bacterium]|jgi:hypothetical protein|nr:hypothetical protein [Deltaproteobacteria bacterium]
MAFRDRYNAPKAPLDLYILACRPFSCRFRLNGSLKRNSPFGRGRFPETMLANLPAFLEGIQALEISFTAQDFTQADLSGIGPGDTICLRPAVPHNLRLMQRRQPGLQGLERKAGGRPLRPSGPPLTPGGSGSPCPAR